MKSPGILFALSADFGEYVTASLFVRGQPFSAHFAVPRALASFIPAGRLDMSQYETVDDLAEIVSRLRPDVVVLASGYLFPVNRIATPEALRVLLARLESGGCAVATTDPWLRIWALRPDSRFAIHSLRKGGVDVDLSGRMQALQGYLEGLFRGVPHLFAVPLPVRESTWMPFFNPEFARQAPPGPARDKNEDDWFFVMSKEDLTLLSGFEGEAFYSNLARRMGELLGRPRNRLRFIGPPELGRFLRERWHDEARVEYIPFCNFAAFESALRRARLVVYWNVISSTLLYCLYYRIPPVFFGRGHQAKVCTGLFEHAVEHLYKGRGPQLLDLAAPLEPDADALIERLKIHDWLDAIGTDYEHLPGPAAVVGKIMGHDVQ